MSFRKKLHPERLKDEKNYSSRPVETTGPMLDDKYGLSVRAKTRLRVSEICFNSGMIIVAVFLISSELVGFRVVLCKYNTKYK